MSCSASITHKDYKDFVAKSNEASVIVSKKTMSINAVASTTTATILQDTEYSASVDVSGVPSGANISYLWNTGETTKTIKKNQHLAGQVSLSCTVTVSDPSYATAVKTSNVVVVTVTQVNVNASLSIIPNKLQANVCEIITLTAFGTSTQPSTGFTYLWNTGETTKTITPLITTIGENVFTCTLTATHVDYGPSTVDDSVTIIAKEVISDGCIRHIHPLPSRASAFIWCGYWVLDELQQAVNDGIDWTQPDNTSLKYKCDLKTISLMMRVYQNVEIQESRNGRIINKSQILSGKIYN